MQIPPTPKSVVLRVVPPDMGPPATAYGADTIPKPASITKTSATPTYPILKMFRDKVEKLPNTVPIADDLSPLAGFICDPVLLTDDVPDDEIWEVWDPHLNRLIPQSVSDIFPLVMRGNFGLIRLVVFFEHIVYDRNVDPGLLDGKIGRILQAIESVCANSKPPASANTNTTPGRSTQPDNFDTNSTASSQFQQVNSAATTRKGRKGTWAIPATISPKWEAARDWKASNPSGSKQEFEKHWHDLQRDGDQLQIYKARVKTVSETMRSHPQP